MHRHGPVIAHCTDSEDFPNGAELALHTGTYCRSTTYFQLPLDLPADLPHCANSSNPLHAGEYSPCKPRTGTSATPFALATGAVGVKVLTVDQLLLRNSLFSLCRICNSNDYMGLMRGLLYGRCMASAAIVASAWFIPTQ